MTALIFFIIFLVWMFLYICLSLFLEQIIKNEYWLCALNIIGLILTLCVSIDLISEIFNVVLI